MSALRAMADLRVDVGIFQEMKINDHIYPRTGFGYSVFATDAPSRWCGGVALFWRECDGCTVEEQRAWGPNVLSFQLVTGRGRFYCIGAYSPPSAAAETDTIGDVQQAWESCPKNHEPILMGDFNADLHRPISERDVAFAEQAAAMDMNNVSRNFRQRRRKVARGRWTWRMRYPPNVIMSSSRLGSSCNHHKHLRGECDKDGGLPETDG